MAKYILRKNQNKPGVQRPASSSVVTVQRAAFGLSPAGHYDLADKRLVNVKLPEGKNDAVNLDYVTEHCLVKNADVYDAKGHRISNLKAPLDKSDAVSLKHFNDNAFIFPKNRNFIQ